MFPFPQWHGVAQKHFPPRPCKTAWHSNVTDGIWPPLHQESLSNICHQLLRHLPIVTVAGVISGDGLNLHLQTAQAFLAWSERTMWSTPTAPKYIVLAIYQAKPESQSTTALTAVMTSVPLSCLNSALTAPLTSVLTRTCLVAVMFAVSASPVRAI